MKDEEKKVNEAEEVKTEENGIELSGDELAQVTGGVSSVAPGHPSELNGGDRRPSARRRRDERPL